MFINLFGLTLWGKWRVGEMGKKTKLIFKIWVFGENVELPYQNLTWVFFSSFAVLVWTVWHHRHHRFGFALLSMLPEDGQSFPARGICRLSSSPLRAYQQILMCWMKVIAGDWPSLTCQLFCIIFGSLLVDCGGLPLCLHLVSFSDAMI